MAKHIREPGKTRTQRAQEWPPPRPGRCNARKPLHQRCKAYPSKDPHHDGVHCAKHQRAIGANHGSWKGGISSRFLRRYMPERLMSRYDALINNPELTSVRELLALTGARLSELLERVASGESAAAWAALDAVFTSMEGVIGKLPAIPEQEALASWLSIARTHYQTARHEQALWQELHDTVERARKLAETEQKREAVLQANLTAQQAIALFNRLFQLLHDEITDPNTRQRVALRLHELLGMEASRGVLLPAAITTSPEAPDADQ